MTTYALLVPEFITVWALRQYIAARDIVRIYNSEIATRKSRDILLLSRESITSGQKRTDM